MCGRLKRSFLAGLAFFLPLGLLAVLGYGLVVLLLGAVSTVATGIRALGVVGVPTTALAGGLLLLGGPVVLVVTGLVLQYRYGELAGAAVDAVVERVPVLGPIYHSLEQSRQVLTDEGFSEVVSLELAEGVDVLAFVVGRGSGADWTTGDRRVTVFVPLAPNPTVGGHLLAVRSGRVSRTGLGVRGALTVLATLGASRPEAADTKTPPGTDPPVAGLYRELVADESPEPSSAEE